MIVAISASLLVPVSVLTALIAVPNVASASSRPASVAASRPVAHNLAPLTKAVIAVSAEDQGSTFNTYEDVTTTSSGPSNLSLLYSNGMTNAGQISITLPSGSLAAGNTYTTAGGATIAASGQGVVTTCTNPLEASVQVDQLTFGSGGAVKTAAVQFLCVATSGLSDIQGTVAYNILPTTPGQGYYVYQSYGQLNGFGNDSYLNYLGTLTNGPLNAPIIGMAITPDGAGYWMVGGDGGVFAFGDATFYGSTGNITLNKPVVGMAATPDGKGYWFVASDGGVFAYGDAKFYGSMGGQPLNQPIVGMAATPDGGGYYLVAADGGIFSFGNAKFYGSMGGIPLNKPIVGMEVTADGMGYQFVATDGGVFSFGDAKFFGSTGSLTLNQPIVGIDRTASGLGYWLVAADGGIFSFGDAVYQGSLPSGSTLSVVGIATPPSAG
jgi:hypothetical protein